MAGVAEAFQTCEQNPIPWAIGTTNPSDYTNFMLGKDTQEYVEDVDDEGNGGDRYLGTINVACECHNVNGEGSMKSKYSNIKYVRPEDNGALDQGNVLPSLCSNFDTDKYNYGTCDAGACILHPWSGWLKSGLDSGFRGAHIFWLRDWSSLFASNEDTSDCCVAPESCTYSEGDSIGDCAVGRGSLPRTLNCPPSHHAGSPLCLPVLQDHCTFSTWNQTATTNCDKYLADFSGAPVTSQQAVLMTGMNNYMNYLDGNKPSSSDPFVSKAATYCAQWPGLCDTSLKTICADVTSDDLLSDPELSRLCGCFMADKEYYLPGIIPIECNGACSINLHPDVNGVPRGQINEDTGMGEAIECDQVSCVMDQITLSMINSYAGSVNFSELCGSAHDGSATCILDGITIDALNASVEGGIDLTQSCNGCASTTTGLIGCDGGDYSAPTSINTNTNTNNSESSIQQAEAEVAQIFELNKPFIIGAIIVIVLLLLAVAFFFAVE